jgi:branched-chain amino acid transport system ATP-binding protein
MPSPDFSASPLLEISGLTSGYGGIQVLWGVDLQVGMNEAVVLLGANGAGKTTLLKTVMGLVEPWGGRVLFDGRDVTRLRTDAKVQRGIAFMSDMSGFPDLTIEENLRVGGQLLSNPELRHSIEEVYSIFPILAERRRSLAGSLSGGQRKMLGIAKALAGRPHLLVMDEPSSGLSPLFVKEVVRTLMRLRARQLALLVAEQNVKFLDLADRVYTLDHGRIGFSGSVAAMHHDDALQRAYFGLR